MEKTTVRLNKFLAERLGLSRRQADDAIAAGKVRILRAEEAGSGAKAPSKKAVATTDKKTAETPVSDEKAALAAARPAILGDRIDKNDQVWYNGRKVPFLTAYTYLGMNKPTGYVCSRRAQGEVPTIFALLPPECQALKTVGRLDKDSSGLILLTNDGDFAFRMTHPSFVKTKVYEVELDHELAPLHQQMIADFGVELADGPSRLGLVKLGNRQAWRVEMSEGRNRQIRRTFAALDYTVTKLHRTDFGPYHLSGLAPGEFQLVEKA